MTLAIKFMTNHVKATGSCRMLGVAFALCLIPISSEALTPTEIFEKVRFGVVVVKALDANGEVDAIGSGVVLPSGVIATNCHVLEDGNTYRVGSRNEFLPAMLVAGDVEKDLCLLQPDRAKIAAEETLNRLRDQQLAETLVDLAIAAAGMDLPVELGKATTLRVGDRVYAVGAPQGLELSMSDGIVSALRGSVPPLIQTTAAISEGSSGGGLFDAEGRLIGITTMTIRDSQNLNFAMPVELLANLPPLSTLGVKQASSSDWIDKASALEKKEDWANLYFLGTEWVEADKNDPAGWFALGLAQYHLDMNYLAVASFRTSIGLLSDSATSWAYLAKAYYELDRYDEAIAAYREALRIDADDESTWFYLGNALFRAEQFGNALVSYQRALKLNPTHVPSLSNLGQTYTNLDRYDDAVKVLRQAVQIDPGYANGWSNLALAYLLSGRVADALSAVRSLRPLDPGQADKLLELIIRR